MKATMLTDYHVCEFISYIILVVQKLSDHFISLAPHCEDKIPKFRNKYSQKRNIGVSVPISTLMRLWVIYIFPIGLPILLEEICRVVDPLTDTRMWKLGLRPRYSEKRKKLGLRPRYSEKRKKLGLRPRYSEKRNTYGIFVAVHRCRKAVFRINIGLNANPDLDPAF